MNSQESPLASSFFSSQFTNHFLTCFESELMKNQKHAEVMAADLKFEVLQTSSGASLFFSIGTDGVFYLTQETTGSKTGWAKWT